METAGGYSWIVETQRQRLRHPMAVRSDTEQIDKPDTREQPDSTT